MSLKTFKMNHASLFSGIGGFDLAAREAGWDNVFQCEIDPFCQSVLRYHFPKTVLYEDIKRTDFSSWKGKVDVLTGGFPCQGFSLAGRRKGTEDDRYLWPEMLRVIRETRPRWVVGENVIGITSMVQPGSETDVETKGGHGEEGHEETVLEQGYVIDTICDDLEREGYPVQPVVIPACGVGAPHRRYRVWFIASDTDSPGLQTKGAEQQAAGIAGDSVQGVATDTRVDGLQGILHYREDDKKRRDPKDRLIEEYASRDRDGREASGWADFPAQPPVCRGDDGLPFDVDDLTIPYGKWRRESIKAYGNAIVPQVAMRIFEMINKIEGYGRQATL